MSLAWKESIHRQREVLAAILKEPLARLAGQCAPVWGKRQDLDDVLLAGFSSIPHCTFLYVLGTDGVQISDNVGSNGLLPEHYGRDRMDRPYMKESVPEWGYLLSHAYISLRAKRPSVTALQVIHRGGEVLGYLGADFDLRNLPITAELYQDSKQWRQIKGDPAIRGMVFQQTRVESPMDRNIEQTMSILEELITDRGVFQGVIHFSSSRATIWTVDDPYRYRILDHEALEDTNICFAYPHRPYPKDALIPQSSIVKILDNMIRLRMADEIIYLRSASFNLFNGMLSLTFSCDGSHYMSHDEFLEKDVGFWFGSAA